MAEECLFPMEEALWATPDTRGRGHCELVDHMSSPQLCFLSLRTLPEAMENGLTRTGVTNWTVVIDDAIYATTLVVHGNITVPCQPNQTSFLLHSISSPNRCPSEVVVCRENPSPLAREIGNQVMTT